MAVEARVERQLSQEPRLANGRLLTLGVEIHPRRSGYYHRDLRSLRFAFSVPTSSHRPPPVLGKRPLSATKASEVGAGAGARWQRKGEGDSSCAEHMKAVPHERALGETGCTGWSDSKALYLGDGLAVRRRHRVDGSGMSSGTWGQHIQWRCSTEGAVCNKAGRSR
jgi:hypothetical protein